MKKLIVGICLCFLTSTGCGGGDSGPKKPEGFAPLPSNAPGGADAGKKKMESKMSNPVAPSS